MNHDKNHDIVSRSASEPAKPRSLERLVGCALQAFYLWVAMMCAGVAFKYDGTDRQGYAWFMAFICLGNVIVAVAVRSESAANAEVGNAPSSADKP